MATAAPAAGQAPGAASPTGETLAGVPTPAAPPPPPVTNWLEAQIELSRRGFSCGAIDGIRGPQTAAALQAFQQSAGLRPTGDLDAPTRNRLRLTAPALGEREITTDLLASLQPLSPTWLGKSEQTVLAFETALEALAERTQAHPALLQRLNPAIDWAAPVAGLRVQAPEIPWRVDPRPVAHLHVRLADRCLQARGADGGLIAHFPVSIAREIAKRPVGSLTVKVIINDPNYTFDPAVFPESEEGRTLGRKLILPPGPNNPVGIAWIGLDRPGYGIHGTPLPEKVGRTESHGCFRLANWDARALLAIVWVGLPVIVEP